MQVDTSFPAGQGGARPGAGRPKGSTNKRPSQSVGEHDPFGDVPAAITDSQQPRLDYNRSRATVEAIKAKNAELYYRIKLGEYVSREAVATACAMAMASFAQAMRSMQDDMERKLNLEPRVVEAIGQYVDTHLEQLAGGLELMTGARDEG